jgi:hypothetical protein
MYNRKTVKDKSSAVKVTSFKKVIVYMNDPYFIEKREAAAAFLKKIGLPESFINQN